MEGKPCGGHDPAELRVNRVPDEETLGHNPTMAKCFKIVGYGELVTHTLFHHIPKLFGGKVVFL